MAWWRTRNSEAVKTNVTHPLAVISSLREIPRRSRSAPADAGTGYPMIDLRPMRFARGLSVSHERACFLDQRPDNTGISRVSSGQEEGHAAAPLFARSGLPDSPLARRLAGRRSPGPVRRGLAR